MGTKIELTKDILGFKAGEIFDREDLADGRIICTHPDKRMICFPKPEAVPEPAPDAPPEAKVEEFTVAVFFKNQTEKQPVDKEVKP